MKLEAGNWKLEGGQLFLQSPFSSLYPQIIYFRYRAIATNTYKHTCDMSTNRRRTCAQQPKCVRGPARATAAYAS